MWFDAVLTGQSIFSICFKRFGGGGYQAIFSHFGETSEYRFHMANMVPIRFVTRSFHPRYFCLMN